MPDFYPILVPIVTELNSAASAIEQAKQALDTTKVSFKVATQRYRSAFRYLEAEFERTVNEDEEEFFKWLESQPLLAKHRYSGMTLGNAIRRVLKYDVGKTLNEIVEELEEGGFYFESDSPSREVNAALMRLSNKKKRGNQYWLEPITDA